MPSTPPAFQAGPFECPFPACGVYAKVEWTQIYYFQSVRGVPSHVAVPDTMVGICDHCHQFSIWINRVMEYPVLRATPPPHPDLPKDILPDYEEARSVFGTSKRSSAALLRLVIQKLCIALGQPGKNLNADIGALVAKGLPLKIQQSLDIVRVIGNNQVHPAQLDVSDDEPTATRLFELVNVIVENQIASPKRIAALYDKLPETARKGIEERDARLEPSREIESTDV
jgi:hypothetical protein